jgi:hypothetical protein
MNPFEDWKYPRLIFYYEDNPSYNKKFTIEDITKPTRELYAFTTGYSSFEEFTDVYLKRTLESLIITSKCALSVAKTSVNSFSDIEEFYRNKRPVGFHRFHEKELNDYFSIPTNNNL